MAAAAAEPLLLLLLLLLLAAAAAAASWTRRSSRRPARASRRSSRCGGARRADRGRGRAECGALAAAGAAAAAGRQQLKRGSEQGERIRRWPVAPAAVAPALLEAEEAARALQCLGFVEAGKGKKNVRKKGIRILSCLSLSRAPWLVSLVSFARRRLGRSKKRKLKRAASSRLAPSPPPPKPDAVAHGAHLDASHDGESWAENRAREGRKDAGRRKRSWRGDRKCRFSLVFHSFPPFSSLKSHLFGARRALGRRDHARGVVWFRFDGRQKAEKEKERKKEGKKKKEKEKRAATRAEK